MTPNFQGISDFVHKNTVKLKTWDNACHVFFSIAALLCFLPQMLGYTLYFGSDDDTLIRLQESHQLETALVVSVVITSLSLLENIIDFVFKRESECECGITYFEFPKIILILILARDFVILYYVLPHHQYDSLNGISLSLDILYTWCYLYNLTRLGNPLWTLPKVFVISCIFTSLNLIYSWVDMSEDVYDKTNVISIMIFLVIAFFLLCVVIGQWIYYVWNNIDESTDTLTYLKVVQANIFIIFLMIYLIPVWGICFVPELPAVWNAFGTSYLVMTTYMMSCCTACVMIITGRVSKFGNIQFSNKILAVRKMFMRYISHEMRTPLNTAVLGINILIKQFEQMLHIPANHICYLTALDLQSSCKIAVEILNEMLLYDKIESKVLALELANISPWYFLNSTVKPFFLEAHALGVILTLQLKIPAFECVVSIDNHKLAQVVRNLISNALKFCQKPGSVDVNIDIVSFNELQSQEFEGSMKIRIPKQDGSIWKSRFRTHNTIYPLSNPENCDYYLRFSVKDDGAGISKENQAKLFHGIIQFNPGKLQNGQGTGLGLYISKGIIHSHHGQLFVKSQGEGQGSTFTFLLPVETSNIKLTPKGSFNSDKTDIPTSEVVKVSESFTLNQTYCFSSADDKHTNSKRQIVPVCSDEKIKFIEATLETSPTEVRILSSDQSFKRIVNVLVVDDSGLCRNMVKRAIEGIVKVGCLLNVDEASDGKEAVTMVQEVMKINLIDDPESLKSRNSVIKVTAEVPYDLILMDYQMPHMDGPTAIHQIRELGYLGKIVGLTGNVLNTEVDKMIEKGANEVLFKPIEYPSLEKLILEL